MLFPEIEKQLDNADKMLNYITKHLPLEDKEKDSQIRKELDQLAAQLRGLLSCAN